MEQNIVDVICDPGNSDAEFKSRTQNKFRFLLESKNEKLVNFILSAYSSKNMNPVDDEGFSPFHIACYGDRINFIEQLNNSKVYVNDCVDHNAKCFSGYSPLHFAVEDSNLKMTQLLLNLGADMSIMDASGRSPFYLACKNRNESIRDLFLSKIFKSNVLTVDDEGFSILFEDLFYKHMIHFNISHSFVFNGSWADWSPLHYAVTLRKIEMVEILLKYGANVQVEDDLGITPLHLGCQWSFEEFSKIIEDEWIINCNEQIQIVELLLAHGADVNAQDKFGKTPFFHALENFVKLSSPSINSSIRQDLVQIRKKLVKLLLKHGANVNISDNDGLTILHDLSDHDLVFSEEDKIDITSDILKCGVNVNAKTKVGKPPLFLTIRNGFFKLTKMLLEHGADVNSRYDTYKRFNPLHTLAYYSEYGEASVDIFNALLKKGAEVNAMEEDGATALHIVIDCHGLCDNIPGETDQMASALLQFGADVDAKDKNGQTPLHRACLNRYNQGTIILLNHGADINVEDEFDNTPLSYACYRIREEKNFSFLDTIRNHVNKLKLIGLHVSKKNELHLRTLEKFYAHTFTIPKIDNFLNLSATEIERLKENKIDNYTSLFNIIFKDANDMISHIKNEEFLKVFNSKCFKNNFQVYGYLLELKLKLGFQRKKLVKPARKSLTNLIKTELPDLCMKIIFKYLTDEDLQNLIGVRKPNDNLPKR
ncbi:hypothetical protein QAD02_008834 [Eretmocerus hayati]|uniref:Uncharacterized protein n=1 Tax=Eretmocerus hayati TaxID=131215 RepID=A0ACC2N7Q3_9HYME|nr:hypothetical protein QAD02_008834 [Eretmocerus hayati]